MIKRFLNLGVFSLVVYLISIFDDINQTKYKEDMRKFKEGYSLRTLEDLTKECKEDPSPYSSYKGCLNYEVHMNERLCDVTLFPNRYKVPVYERKDNFGNRVFDLEITKYPEYFYNGKGNVEGTITDVISGEVYELKEILEYNVLDIGEITVTFDYFTTYKWLPLEKCEGKFR